MKAYQVPNLVKVYEASISITPETSEAVSGFEAINLIQNLENRSSGNDIEALIVYSSNEYLG